jgi:hypothetical protein
MLASAGPSAAAPSAGCSAPAAPAAAPAASVPVAAAEPKAEGGAGHSGRGPGTAAGAGANGTRGGLGSDGGGGGGALQEVADVASTFDPNAPLADAFDFQVPCCVQRAPWCRAPALARPALLVLLPPRLPTRRPRLLLVYSAARLTPAM